MEEACSWQVTQESLLTVLGRPLWGCWGTEPSLDVCKALKRPSQLPYLFSLSSSSSFNTPPYKVKSPNPIPTMPLANPTSSLLTRAVHPQLLNIWHHPQGWGPAPPNIQALNPDPHPNKLPGWEASLLATPGSILDTPGMFTSNPP